MADEQVTQEETQGTKGNDLVPAGLREQLLEFIADHLSSGETLITEAHFQKAVEEGCRALTQAFPPQRRQGTPARHHQRSKPRESRRLRHSRIGKLDYQVLPGSGAQSQLGHN